MENIVNNEEVNHSDENFTSKLMKIKNNKLILGSMVLVVVIILFLATGNLRTYNKAKKMMSNNNYTEAIKVFEGLNGYRDSEEKINVCKYQTGKLLIQEKKYSEAVIWLEDLKKSDYKDARELYNLCNYERGEYFFGIEEYYEASLYFSELAELDYKDSQDRYKECLYSLGKQNLEKGEYEQALNCLKDLNYKDSEELVYEIEYGEKSLNQFIERYNQMAEFFNDKLDISLEKISVEDIEDNAIESATGATIKFNVSTENEDIFRYNIDAFMWDKTAWVFADSDYLIADWFCTLAGFLPNSSYESIEKILVELIDNAGDGIYGSVTKDGYFYTTSRTQKEMTLAGKVEK